MFSIVKLIFHCWAEIMKQLRVEKFHLGFQQRQYEFNFVNNMATYNG